MIGKDEKEIKAILKKHGYSPRTDPLRTLIKKHEEILPGQDIIFVASSIAHTFVLVAENKVGELYRAGKYDWLFEFALTDRRKIFNINGIITSEDYKKPQNKHFVWPQPTRSELRRFNN